MLEKFRATASALLNRPHGGMEVEMIISATEIAQALMLFVGPQTLWQTRAFQDFVYWGVPAWIIGIPWAAAGIVSWVGIVFSLNGKVPECAPMRWMGAFLSTILWGWVAIKTGAVADWSIVYVFICLLFSLWSIRSSVSAWRRWGLLRP